MTTLPENRSHLLHGAFIAALTWALCASACVFIYSLPSEGDVSIASFYPFFRSLGAVSVILVSGGIFAVSRGKGYRNGFLLAQLALFLSLVIWFRVT